MKFLITQEQFDLLNEVYRRDRWDAEYSDEYPKYKNILMRMIHQNVKGRDKKRNSIYLMSENGDSLFVYREPSKTLYYDYSIEDDMEDIIPYHIIARHLKNAVYDYFKKLFPDVEIKEISGSNIG